MSFQNYEKAMNLAKKKKYYTTVGGRSDETIKRAEEMLGVKFSPQYRAFNENYGYLSFFGCEIFGADPDDLDELEGNCVAYALNDRSEYNLSNNLIPIFNFDDGCMAYMDYSVINSSGEPNIVVAEYDGSEYRVQETIAEDFGDFVLGLVEQDD